MHFPKKEKKLSEKEAYLKICSWCAYQERSHREVRNKLYEYGLNSAIIDEIISKLIEENFLNEQRFACTYAGGKFRLKKWGRNKIRQGLKEKQVSENCIRFALHEIDERDYIETLTSLIEKKKVEFRLEQNEFVKNRKIADYLIRKGYEPDLVWEMLK